MNTNPLACLVILAGGQSSRMGTDKAVITLGGGGGVAEAPARHIRFCHNSGRRAPCAHRPDPTAHGERLLRGGTGSVADSAGLCLLALRCCRQHSRKLRSGRQNPVPSLAGREGRRCRGDVARRSSVFEHQPAARPDRCGTWQNGRCLIKPRPFCLNNQNQSSRSIAFDD